MLENVCCSRYLDSMQKFIMKLQDDLTGEAADETIRFGLDGVSFTIDLSEKHADEFHKALTPYLNAARPRTARAPSAR